jgi:hypothetical protein
MRSLYFCFCSRRSPSYNLRTYIDYNYYHQDSVFRFVLMSFPWKRYIKVLSLSYDRIRIWQQQTSLFQSVLLCRPLSRKELSRLLLLLLLAYFPYVEKIKGGRWDHLAVYMSVRLCVPHNPVARQRFGKHVSATTNGHARTEELLDAMFSMRFVSYQLLNK